MISAVVLTKNEENNIIKCLASLNWVDEIIVIDDFSVDLTINRIQKLKNKRIKIYKRRLNDDFAGQRNYGLSKAKDDWILFLDADETLSKFLSKEILLKTKNTKYDGFYIKRRDYFLGHEMKHGEVGDIKLLRLGRKNSGKWERKVHEYWNIKGESQGLHNFIIHSKNQSLNQFISKIDKYSEIHAKELKAEGKRSNLLRIIIWPTGKFIYNYFFKLGFLDGVEGFILATIMSFHSFLAWTKLWIS